MSAGAFAEAARAEFDRYRAVYPDFPAHIEVRDDILPANAVALPIIATKLSAKLKK